MTGPDGSATAEAQRDAVERAMKPVAELAATGVRIVIVHGNGPQVGNLLVKNQLAARVVPPMPLDWCVAQTQATIGTLILDALEPLRAATVVTRTRVDPADPAFADPVKPVGRYFSQQDAERFPDQTWRSFGPRGWRRVVPSPEPLEILDAPAVDVLLEAGFIVVAAGGGGVPVAGGQGVEAVIDKDLAAQLLARHVGADTLVIATDVAQAMIDYGTPEQRPIGRVGVAELRAYAAAGQFAGGSMGPKVEALLRFADAGGARGVITSLDHLGDALHGRAGTILEREPEGRAPNAATPTAPRTS